MSIEATIKVSKLGKKDKDLGTVEYQAIVNIENKSQTHICRAVYHTIFRNKDGLAIGVTSGDSVNVNLKNSDKMGLDVGGFILDSQLGDRKKGEFEIYIKLYGMDLLLLGNTSLPKKLGETSKLFMPSTINPLQCEISQILTHSEAGEKGYAGYHSETVVVNKSENQYDYFRLVQSIVNGSEEINSSWDEVRVEPRFVSLFAFTPFEISKKIAEKSKCQLHLHLYKLVETKIVKIKI